MRVKFKWGEFLHGGVIFQFKEHASILLALQESGFRLTDNQIVNHFPNHYELTRKDLIGVC